jgi:hypothetical protein
MQEEGILQSDTQLGDGRKLMMSECPVYRDAWNQVSYNPYQYHESYVIDATPLDHMIRTALFNFSSLLQMGNRS